MRSRILISILLTMLLAGCQAASGTTPAPTTDSGQPTQPGGCPEPGSGYPAQTQDISALPSAYPAAPTATLSATSTPDANQSPVIIESVTHTEDGLEVITVKNISQTEQDISLFSLLNPDTQEFYAFPPNYLLKPGEAIFIYNGTGATYPNGQKWLDKPFLTVTGASVQMLNQAARIIYTFVYSS